MSETDNFGIFVLVVHVLIVWVVTPCTLLSGDSMFLQTVGIHLHICTVSQPAM